MFLPTPKSAPPDLSLNRLFLCTHLLFAFLMVSFPFFPSIADELVSDSSHSKLGSLDDPEFISGWGKYSQEKDARPLKSWFKTHPEVEMGSCKFRSLDDFEGLQYFSLDCPGKKRNGFFYSGKEKVLRPENIKSFRVKGPVKIGKMVYWELAFSKEDLRNANLRPGRKSKMEKDSKIESPVSTENFGLQYFLSIAKHPSDRPTPVGKEIFFDSSCPLLYLGKDADFYWDKVLYFSFQASCLPDSPYSWIRIKADAGGNVLVDDKPAESLKEGERFLAKLKLHSIEKDKIVWSEAELFHE